MRHTMEQSSLDSRHQDGTDFSLKEWALKAKISRTNTSSGRFSESNLKSFGENAMSFRSNITISSTASSPAGYTLTGEIDPSTYSFTTALKALQAKTWEYLSPDGLTLNSKWNDAERYICNPLSGQVPIECLSAKTLSERSFRTRFTMSAPLIYPASSSMHHTQYAESPISEHQSEVEVTSQEKKRDMGSQSMPVDHSSSSLSPALTPSIEERSVKIEYGDSSISSENLKSETEVEEEGNRDEQYTKRKKQTMSRCSHTQRGCLSLRGLWLRTVKREDHKTKNKQHC